MAENKVCFVFQNSGIQTVLELSWNLQIRGREVHVLSRLLLYCMLHGSSIGAILQRAILHSTAQYLSYSYEGRCHMPRLLEIQDVFQYLM